MSLKKLAKLSRSLAMRLTIWYAGVFLVSTLLAFVFLYLLLPSLLREQTDQNLMQEVGVFASLLKTRGVEAVRNVAIIEAQAAGEKKTFFRLLYPTGQAFSSSNMSYWQNIPIHLAAIRRLVGGEQYVFRTIALPDRQHRVRLLYSQIGSGVILQLGQSLEQQARIVVLFRQTFVIAISALTILAAVVGWFMARRALVGVATVTSTAQRIAEGALSQRVPVKARGDEIDRLASTFNLMLDRIEQLIAGIREMSDNIAHDLKSPVTRIRGLAEITLTTGSRSEDFENMAASTIEECDRLLELIDTMLMISKTEAGAHQLQWETVDPAALLRTACELFRPVAEDQGLELVCKTGPDAACRGDLQMLQRMVANLLDNAIKYTAAGGRIEAALSVDKQSQVIISVSDSGEGIAPRDLPLVFDRFYRCDQSRAPSGSGLGLSLARAIAHAHGGSITVSSRLGQGSTFRIALPVDQPYSAPMG